MGEAYFRGGSTQRRHPRMNNSKMGKKFSVYLNVANVGIERGNKKKKIHLQDITNLIAEYERNKKKKKKKNSKRLPAFQGGGKKN